MQHVHAYRQTGIDDPAKKFFCSCGAYLDETGSYNPPPSIQVGDGRTFASRPALGETVTVIIKSEHDSEKFFVTLEQHYPDKADILLVRRVGENGKRAMYAFEGKYVAAKLSNGTLFDFENHPLPELLDQLLQCQDPDE